MKNKHSIFKKLFINYSIIIIASFLIFITLLVFLIHNSLYNKFADTYNHQLTQIETFIAEENRLPDTSSLITHYDYNIYIADASDVENSDRLPPYLKNVLQDILASGEKVTSNDRYNGELHYVIGSPLKAPESSEKFVFLMDFGNLDHTYREFIIIILLTLFITVCIATFIIWIISRKITAPLTKLNQASVEYAKGNFTEKVQYNSDDEIGELTAAFNHMASQLNLLEERRKEFLSNVSHDLRTPLTSLKGFLIAFRDGTIPDSKKDYYYHLMERETERMIKMVNDTLTLSRLEENYMTLNRRGYSLTEQVEEVISKAEPIYRKKNLMIILNDDGDKNIVYADREKMEQVIINLLQNAVNFSTAGEQIVIDLKSRGDKVHFKITDTGAGIKEEDISRIWERFYKADVARTDRSGTGIGLAIVKQITTLHGFDVKVTSSSEKGTTFEITMKNSR
ncbi:MAG: HAMP domain-containing sensor histidine kinase [Jeotgalicoccus sp.]|nr:HAMP domain-containing sensor histidine kinase [Jeotgalicoccus sp.]